jgi:hypothetical protein
MSTFPDLSRLFKGGLVWVSPVTGAIGRSIARQYNPDTLSRTLYGGIVYE